MSGSTASRYIGGVPYGPGRSVGRYPNAASVGAAPGVSPGVPGLGAVGGGAGGGGVVAPVSSGAGLGAPSGGGGGGNMLLAAALGALPLLGYAPDAIDWVDRQFSAPAPEPLPQGWDAGSFTGPGGVQIPNAALGGFGTNWNNIFEPGWTVDPVATQALLDAPMPAGDQFAGLAGDVAAANDAIGTAGGGEVAGAGGWLSNPLGLPASFMSADLGLGLGSLGGVNLDAAAGNLAYLPAAVFARGTSTFAKPGGELGGQIGTGVGTAIGTILGGPWGAAAGAIAGGAIGGQIGPAPTIGRNFSSIGTFGGDGQLHWGSSGGDNGASAADADPFSNWFGQNLLQQAAAQGYGFNPNMAGAQIRVGGYDNFSRRFDTPGGYFYTPDTGGSPENYALRPSDDWSAGGFGADQARDFSRNVLADLTARGAFIRPGEQGQGLDYWGSTQGAPLGWYGSENGDYSRIQSGGGDFNSILGDRQGAITGWVNQQQAIAQQQAAAQAQLDQSNRWAGQNVGFDPMTMLNAQNDPMMASVMGLGGVQWGENGPMFVGPAPGGAIGPLQADGGA